MSGLTFRLKAAPAWRLDLSPLTPDRLAAVAARDVPRISILGGNRTTPAGDLFEIVPALIETLEKGGAS